MHIHSLKYAARIASGRHPSAFFLLQRFFGERSERCVTRDTEIVIEGFPRSANSFAKFAFEEAQGRPVRIAHHLHSPAQILRAVSFGTPCLTLIREPEEAIRSLLVRDPHIAPIWAIKHYISFYSSILAVKDQIVVGEFHTVTTRFDTIIDMINQKYGTNFTRYYVSDAGTEAIFVRIERSAMGRRTRAGAPFNPYRHPRPSEEKNKKKAALDLRRYKCDLATAHDLYLVFAKA